MRVTRRSWLYLCEHTWYWLPSPLYAVLQREGATQGYVFFSFPQTTCYLSALPVTYRAFICITSPLWHVPSSSRALYIVTGNCVFAMAA